MIRMVDLCQTRNGSEALKPLFFEKIQKSVFPSENWHFTTTSRGAQECKCLCAFQCTESFSTVIGQFNCVEEEKLICQNS